MTDWMLVAIIVAVGMSVSYLLASIAYAQRVYDIQLECQERIGAANREVIQVRQMLADTEMQRRVMGSVPVSRLIKEDDDEG